MPRKWRKIGTYHTWLVFAAAGVFATILAWESFNLVQTAMSNTMFIRENGLMGLADGGAMQLAGLLVRGLIALAAYIGFKVCEVELVVRLRR